jgi:hypothetical protein
LRTFLADEDSLTFDAGRRASSTTIVNDALPGKWPVADTRGVRCSENFHFPNSSLA